MFKMISHIKKRMRISVSWEWTSTEEFMWHFVTTWFTTAGCLHWPPFWMTTGRRPLTIPEDGQKIPWEMVAMPTGAEQPDQLTYAVNCYTPGYGLVMTSLPLRLCSISTIVSVDPGMSQRNTMVEDAAQCAVMPKYNGGMVRDCFLLVYSNSTLSTRGYIMISGRG